MLDVIARRRGRTPAQVALNWVICKGAVPIPGARTKAQAVENCGAAGWRLRPEDVQALDAVAVLDGGYYNDPEAVLTFLRLRIRLPAFFRGVVHAVVRFCLRVGAYFPAAAAMTHGTGAPFVVVFMSNEFSLPRGGARSES